MSDLVERLRDACNKGNISAWPTHHIDIMATYVMQAADEIERLRRQITYKDEVIEQRNRMIDRLEDELARYHEAYGVQVLEGK